MKEPKKRLSSAEFSFLIVRLCLMLGCIAMIVVLCTAEGQIFTVYNVIIIVLMAIVSFVCLLSLVLDFLNKRKDEEK